MSITIKNISSSTVTISVPELRFRRDLVPGRVLPINKDEYEALTFDPGFNTMVRQHYIKVDGAEDNPIIDETVESIFDVREIARMLEEQDITSFAKFIPNASEAEKESVIKLAVEKNVTANAFTALINKYCGVDVIKAINAKHLAEEK